MHDRTHDVYVFTGGGVDRHMQYNMICLRCRPPQQAITKLDTIEAKAESKRKEAEDRLEKKTQRRRQGFAQPPKRSPCQVRDRRCHSSRLSAVEPLPTVLGRALQHRHPVQNAGHRGHEYGRGPPNYKRQSEAMDQYYQGPGQVRAGHDQSQRVSTELARCKRVAVA